MIKCLFNGYERFLLTLIGCLETEQRNYPQIEKLSTIMFDKIDKYEDWEVTNLPKNPT